MKRTDQYDLSTNTTYMMSLINKRVVDKSCVVNQGKGLFLPRGLTRWLSGRMSSWL